PELASPPPRWKCTTPGRARTSRQTPCAVTRRVAIARELPCGRTALNPRNALWRPTNQELEVSWPRPEQKQVDHAQRRSPQRLVDPDGHPRGVVPARARSRLCGRVRIRTHAPAAG